MAATFGQWIAEKQRSKGLDRNGKTIRELVDPDDFGHRVRLRRGRNVHAARIAEGRVLLTACSRIVGVDDHRLGPGQPVNCQACLMFLQSSTGGAR